MLKAIILVATALGLVFGGSAANSSQALAGPPYKNCTEAHKDGRYNIPQDDDAYSSKLDRDGDGLACEPKP